MKVDLYERWWLWAAGIMIAGFLAAITWAASLHAVHPPSHIETLDPLRVRIDSEFANPGVRTNEAGETEVIMVAEMFRFEPAVARVPAGAPVRLRLTSPDVLHGVQIVGTNVNVTVAPGYVSELLVRFPKAGEYLVLCNEYCGLSHHLMQGRLLVEDVVDDAAAEDVP